jgi:serine protease Do
MAVVALVGLLVGATAHAQTQDLPNVTSVFESQKSSVVTVTAQMGGGGGSQHPFFREKKQTPRMGQGSGFIIDEEGYVLTNHHVVSKADDIKVSLMNGDTYEAELVGSDKKYDVALLKVEPSGSFPAVELGDSAGAKVGEWVVAIGNPFGLNYSVTTGIISAKGRTIGHSAYDNFIQTDASINPGNSGGPLFDMQGRVIGMNTAIVKRGQGIGFAVPVDMIKEILPQLKSKGYVERGYIGARLQPLDKRLAKSFGVSKDFGVLIAGVEEGGPADKAGLRRGDIVIKYQGDRIRKVQQLMFAVAETSPGSEAAITVWRDGDRRELTVTLTSRPDSQQATEEEPSSQEGTSKLGVEVTELNQRIAAQLDVSTDAGVLVKSVQPGSPASGALKRGDIIQQVGRSDIQSPEDVKAAMSGLEEGDVVRLRILRRGRGMFLAIQL